MLIPQFSIRWLLALTTVCAGVFAIFRAAVLGSGWATGVSVGIVSAVVLLLVYAMTFAVVWLFSLLPLGRGRTVPGQSPFSSGTPTSTPGKSATDEDTPATPIILD